MPRRNQRAQRRARSKPLSIKSEHRQPTPGELAQRIVAEGKASRAILGQHTRGDER